MSLSNFIAYLQQLLTMVNPRDERTVDLAKEALQATVNLAFMSWKADPTTLRAMRHAVEKFSMLAMHANDFAGKPGHFKENEQKRRRLASVVLTHC